MEPTLHGCEGCTGDRIFVNKLAYRFGGDPEPGDVVVFVGPDSWNDKYVSQRSDNSVTRGIQTGLSYIGILAPDENTLVKRVIATGGQTVQCLAGDPGVMVDGKEVDLTASEFKLLTTLSRYPGRVYSRMELVEKVLGYDFEGYERTIDSHVKNLRAKIGDNPRNPKWLHTVHGVGYRFEDPTKQVQ